MILYCFWHVLCGVQIQWPMWSNMHIYKHSICYCFCFISKSYHLNITRIIWKPNFRFFFLINCPLLIISPVRIPCVCLSIGNHIILSASHMCATLNLNQESKFLSVQVRRKIEAYNVIDWKSTKQKPINTQSHIYVRVHDGIFFGPNSRMTHSEWVRERKEILNENLPIPIRYQESPCLKYKK